MSENESDTPSLRTTGSQPVRSAAPLSTGGFGANDAVELVVDLLAATKLVPADKLALARGRAQQTGSLAAALVEEGVASAGTAPYCRRALVDMSTAQPARTGHRGAA